MVDLDLWTDIAHSAVRILIIWLLASILLRFLHRVLTALRQRIASRADQKRDLRRIETLSSVFRHTANVVIVGLALMLTLSEIGISVTPILATAGVAGIAIGFGAQSLVKDFFSGFFLLLENQVSEGDIIEAAGKSGYVERVTLRHVRIRDYDGSVHYIPNGLITIVTNRSRDYAYAVIDMDFPRKEEPARIFERMRAVTAAMRADPKLGPSILDDIDIAGVEKLDDASFTVRCRLMVLPSRQWRVRREFLLRMRRELRALQEAGG